MTETAPSLYERLGGYDAVSAVANNLLPRLMGDEKLGRFWSHRGADGIKREKQLLIDFLSSCAGGPVYYTARNMTLTHQGMQISDDDWWRFSGHVHATLDHFKLADPEKGEVVAFIESIKPEIVEA
jgi:hemoglobin